MSVILKYSYNI